MELHDIPRIWGKEVVTALLCGLSLAGANFLKMLFFDHLDIKVAAVICLTLMVTVLAADFVGCTLPILATKAGFDPTVMAAPIMTTVIDAISLLIYFQIATMIFDEL